ncbi:hypothetical protein SEA_ECLIPTUS_91 [Gordonia phage Ecliptus]|uniref:Uncharacterized protein n=1 Tax=Gordonia phage Apricot TaxID=2250319 RepID=A0A345L191_9CAUD|nr:hypothetical protein HOT72_gp084 [Gordonia phage Apricot]AXH49043.1 hypothetical protein SEA_APRICOT_84 [Gordonia phage Apricot]WAB10656.1 hypothetical protein SEA_ECLIPTUS_91 [Gordonia phage Ecliptus]
MSVPSLESLIAQHLPLHGEYRAGNVGCTCGWEAFVKVDPIAHDLDEFKTETFAKHVAEVIRQHHATVVELPAAHERKTLTTPNGQPYEVAVWDFPYARVATVVGSAEDGPVIDVDPMYPLNAADFEALGLALLAASRLAADGAEDHQ